METRGARDPEVFHARFVDHAYPAHTHDAWTVFTVDEESIAYDLERRHRGVAGSKVTLLPPHVVRDGRPAASSVYRKRVLYVVTEVLGEHLIGPAVDSPILDPPLGRHLCDRRVDDDDRPGVSIAEQLRDLLDARLSAWITLAEAGRILEVSPAHLVRSFTHRSGISLHRYLVGRRIEAARGLLLDGQSAARVAADGGRSGSRWLSSWGRSSSFARSSSS